MPVFFLDLAQVALWAWDIVVDNCAICRNHIMDLCKFDPPGECFFYSTETGVEAYL
jgi:hypothetical protein